MYNNFLVQKHKKQLQQKSIKDRRLKKWLNNYHQKVQPTFVDNYHQRVNNFITKVEENPWQLEKYQALDVKQEKQQHMKNKISEMHRKGGKIFKFRDANDFISYFPEADRIQRKKNKDLFEKKYGDPDMAYRSIASQSEYNPNLLNQFRKRSKQKQINPPMRYTSKNLPLSSIAKRKSYSVSENKRKKSQKLHNNKNYTHHNSDEQEQQMHRNHTSYSGSFMGHDEEVKSVQSINCDSQSSRKSHQKKQRNQLNFVSNTMKHFYHNNTLQNKKPKRSQTAKSYFTGINDIKQSSNDPHTKKLLHNILVKIGKTHPNTRDKALASNIEILSSEIS